MCHVRPRRESGSGPWPGPWENAREASRRADAGRGPRNRGGRPDRRAAAAASPLARARPGSLARRMGPETARRRLERASVPHRRGVHAPAASSRDRRQLRRRLRPCRRQMGRRARRHRHPYAGRARRRGRRHRDGADAHGGAPAAAGRALPARRRMAEVVVSADRVAARTDDGNPRPRANRQGDRQARRKLRAQGRLSRPQAPARCSSTASMRR